MEAADISSLNTAVMVVLALTPLAPLAGVTDVTVGGVASTNRVVNVQLNVLASALPAASFTPDAPPMILAVYNALPASAAEGVKVTVRVAALYATVAVITWLDGFSN